MRSGAAPFQIAQRGLARLTGLIIILVWVGVLGGLLIFRQPLMDWWALADYTAPATIADLATQDSMTDASRRIFYVNHPELADKSAFSKDCPSTSAEKTIVLGCYHGGQNGIFLLDVTDSRLDGVKQVTAAHEMLHAAYDRLGSSEKQRINALLTDYYQNKLLDERIKATIDDYKKTEPNDVINEMHSIFGTEIPQLPDELETYYQKYFTNRQAVVTFSAKYKSEFTSRQTAIAAADKQLDALKAQINSNNSELKAALATIESRRETMLRLRSSDPAAYNAQVGPYNALIDSYNREVEATQALVSQYNQVVADRNALVFEQQQLAKELDANTPTINH